MRSPEVEVRVPANVVPALLKGIQPCYGRESVVFGLASHTTVGNKLLLLVRDIMSLPNDAYIDAPAHGAMWSGASMLPVLNAAMSRRLGVVLFHAHGGDVRRAVELSEDDRSSAGRLLPVFHNLVPDRPHASVVIGDRTSAAIVCSSGTGLLIEPKLKTRFLTGVVRDLPSVLSQASQVDEAHMHHRQSLLVGGSGQLALGAARIGVVGLSGGGSHVVQQLAHVGVGCIVGVDPDRAHGSNRGRLVGMAPWDPFLRRLKTAIMRRMVRRTNRHVAFEGIPYRVPEQAAIDALKACDIIVGAVDNYHARADLQDLAWQYLIPYVDIGMLIRPSDSGPGHGDQLTIGGHVIVSIPGGACLWCFDCLTQKKLDDETGGRPRSYFEGTTASAQVVSFNGVLASQAVNEVLQLITGFAPTSGDDPAFLKMNGLDGTLERWRTTRRCPKGHAAVGGGDVVWRAA